MEKEYGKTLGSIAKMYEGSWHEKRELSLQTLRRKVQFALDLYEETERMQVDEPDIGTRLDGAWQRALALFGPTAEERFAQYQTLGKKFGAIQKQIDESPDGSPAIDTYLSSQGNIDEQMMKLDENGEMEFLRRIDIIRKALVKKHHEVRALSDDHEKLAQEINKRRERGKTLLDFRHIIRVERGPLSVSAVIAKEHYRLLFKDSVGTHLTGTPFNIICERTNRKEEASTIYHENVHNLTDGAVSIENPARFFTARLDRYERLKEMGAPEVIMKNEAQVLGDRTAYLNFLHGELLAAFEQAEEQKFGRRGDFSKQIERYFFSAGDAEFVEKTSVFSTAGLHARDFIGAIREQQRTTQDPELRLLLQKLEEEMHRGFLRIVACMDRSLHVAETLGDRTRDEVEMLFYLLSPTQYHHIEKYLETFFDARTVRGAFAAEKLRTFFALDDLRDGVSVLRANPALLTDKLKKEIVAHVYSLTGQMLGRASEAGFDAPEALREYVSLLRALQKRCAPRDPEFAFLAHHVQYAFFSGRLEDDLENQFANIPALCQQLTAAERKELLSALELYFDGGFITEDLAKLGLIDPRQDGWQQIKVLPIWGVIKKLGFATRLEKELGK